MQSKFVPRKRRHAGCDRNAKWRRRNCSITFGADINEQCTSHQGFVMSCMNHLLQDLVLILKSVDSKVAPLCKTVIFNQLKRQRGNGLICNMHNVAKGLLVLLCILAVFLAVKPRALLTLHLSLVAQSESLLINNWVWNSFLFFSFYFSFCNQVTCIKWWFLNAFFFFF